jgi:hypothetical protein
MFHTNYHHISGELQFHIPSVYQNTVFTVDCKVSLDNILKSVDKLEINVTE